MLKIDAVDITLVFVVVLYVICCPFSKVEESFNMQALFDLMQFGTDLNNYDHLEFPGVVPRTFIGALFVAVITYPAHVVMRLFDLPVEFHQMACRIVLGTLSCLSLAHFRNGVSVRFGERASQLTGILVAFQFHLCFYMSRTLPNIFALIFCLNAFGFWLKVTTAILFFVII